VCNTRLSTKRAPAQPTADHARNARMCHMQDSVPSACGAAVGHPCEASRTDTTTRNLRTSRAHVQPLPELPCQRRVGWGWACQPSNTVGPGVLVSSRIPSVPGVANRARRLQHDHWVAAHSRAQPQRPPVAAPTTARRRGRISSSARATAKHQAPAAVLRRARVERKGQWSTALVGADAPRATMRWPPWRFSGRFQPLLLALLAAGIHDVMQDGMRALGSS
jgi:hypothetical protein